MNFDAARRRILAQLREMPDFLDKACGLLSAEAGRRRPQGDDLALVEHLWHLRDCETDLYAPRIERTLAEQAPAFEGVMVNDWPRERGYLERPITQALAEFRQHREQLLERLGSLSAADFQRPAHLLASGREVDLYQLVEMLADHDRDHRGRIAKILAESAH